MAPRKTPARRAPPSRPAPTARGIALAEAAESMAAVFDEACAHALALPESGGLALGPLLPVPLADLEPGALGWSRKLKFPPSDGGGEAEVLVVLVPAGRPTGAGSPLRGSEPGAVTLVKEQAGPPRAVLLARGSRDVPRARLAGFFRRMVEVLGSEAGGD